MHLLLTLACLAAAQPAPGPTEAAVKLPAGKYTVRAALVRPAGNGPFPALVVVPGDFGLSPWVRQQARRLAGKGYLVLAVDLYDGELPKTIEEAHILERGLPEDQVRAYLRAAVDALAARPDVGKGAIGVLGWDSGGGYALDAAIADARLRTAVVCYGRVPTDAASLAPLRGDVLAIFAGKDEGISPATIAQFRQATAKAGKRVTVHVYPKCGNGFLDPDSPYAAGPPDRAAIADAWTKIEAHLAARLK